MDNFNPMIYDIEATTQDWLVVARKLRGGKHHVIHNDAKKLRELLLADEFFGGFNNKHYDDGMVTAMMNNASNKIVKDLNDWIISERELYWEHPFMEGKYKKFDSFDSRDDIDVGVSLKSIMANKGHSIVESSVPFTIKTKWTEKELAEMIYYCKSDVDETCDYILDDRLSYMAAKKSVGARVGLSERESISMTNAKLAAKYLGAKKIDHKDGDNYQIADTLEIGKYGEVLGFYQKPRETYIKILEDQFDKAKTDRQKASIRKKIDKFKKSGKLQDTFFTTKIAGVTHKFGWGGIHGARNKYYAVSDSKYIILLIDVGSYYPSMMIEYGFISRNIPYSDDFVKVYNERMAAKLMGDWQVSNDLKLVLNTTYGAMKNKYNDLYDPRAANSICASGQLLLTDLVDKLEAVKSMTLIQSNTDGIMIKVDRTDLQPVHRIVSAWEKRTRLNMEYTEVQAIAQKDVNNYMLVEGDVYLIKDGEKVIEKKSKNKITAIGSWLKKWDGGNFVNNSLSVIDKALVYKLVYNIDVEKTIMDEKDVIGFQMIAKSGSTFDYNTQLINNEHWPVQKVNRVYAVRDKRLGRLFKWVEGEKPKLIESLPDHCHIDNEGLMTIDAIDKSWYINLANERLADVVGKRNIGKITQVVEYKETNEEDDKMSEKTETKTETKKATTKTTKKEEVLDTAKMSIYQKLSNVRKEFMEINPKKTGVNTFSEFLFFELSDIVPVKNGLLEKYNLVDIVSFTETHGTLTLIDIDDVDGSFEHIEFTTPIDKLVIKGMNVLQAIGSMHTYMRRYLYMLLLDLVELDQIDANIGNPELDEPVEKKKSATKKKTTTKKKPATANQRQAAKKEIINKDGEADASTISSIKRGLKKYRSLDGDEAYITKVVEAMKKKPNNTQATTMLKNLGKKIKEQEALNKE